MIASFLLILFFFLEFAASQSFNLTDNNLLLFGSGAVCDDGFFDQEADAVCKLLGFAGAESYSSASIGELDFSIESLDCPEGVTSASQCDFATTHDCSNSEGVQLDCLNTALVFSVDDSGLLHYGAAYVCDTGFGESEANAVCRFMGHGNVISWSASEQAPVPIFSMRNLDCQDGVVSIGQCTFEWGYLGCNTGTTISIQCDDPNHPQGCVDVEINIATRDYAYEIFWVIENSYCLGQQSEPYEDHQSYTQTCCLVPGEYDLICLDGYGDGWQDAEIEIQGITYCKNFEFGTIYVNSITIYAPTACPSSNPSYGPTPTAPSILPSFSPSQLPSNSPTLFPSIPPTATFPSTRPSQAPSPLPSDAPSATCPSRNPTASVPSSVPSNFPTTEMPSVIPTMLPSSEVPTMLPSFTSPSTFPSSDAPSKEPTPENPTLTPSQTPTSQLPTQMPTSQIPTQMPSSTSPSSDPSFFPSVVPSIMPTSQLPTQMPTLTSPSLDPSFFPSVVPSIVPTTEIPSLHPNTPGPTISPSPQPSSDFPTGPPTTSPTTEEPSMLPSFNPSFSAANFTDSDQDLVVNTEYVNVGVNFIIISIGTFLIFLICICLLWIRLKEATSMQRGEGEPSPRFPRSAMHVEQIHPWSQPGHQGEGFCNYSDEEGGGAFYIEESVDLQRRHTYSTTTSTYDPFFKSLPRNKSVIVKRHEPSMSDELYQIEGEAQTRPSVWKRFPKFSVPRGFIIHEGNDDSQSMNSSLPPLPGRLSYEL